MMIGAGGSFNHSYLVDPTNEKSGPLLLVDILGGLQLHSFAVSIAQVIPSGPSVPRIL